MSVATQLTVSAIINEQNPWPGLASFDESAERFFRGRQHESADLARLVKSSHLVVLFGASGMGKTSLLHAGLFPLLRRAHILPVYLRLAVTDRSKPLIEQARSAFVSELSAQHVEAPSFETGESLWEYLHRDNLELWSPQNHLLTPLFVFDQFEEVLTLGDVNPEGIAELRKDLGDLVENRVPESVSGKTYGALASRRYKVLLSFREDYLAGFERWKREIPSIMRNRYGLAHMNGIQALEVVAGPGKGIISESVSQLVVRFVAAARDEENHEERPFDSLQVEPALLSVVCNELNVRRRAQGNETIDRDDLEAARGNILDGFYERSFQGLRPEVRIFVEDRLLTASGFRNTAPEEEAVVSGLDSQSITQLIDRRLIRREQRLGATHVELTHDLLTKVVRSSRDARLQRALQAASEEKRIREERRKRSRIIRLIVSIAGVLISILAVLALLSAREARRQTERAAAERLETERLQAVAFATRVNESAISPDQNFMVTVRDGKAFVLNNAGMISPFPEHPEREEDIYGVAFSPEGRILVTTGPTTVRLWEVPSGRSMAVLRGHEGPVYTVAFTSDLKYLVTCSYDETAIVWEVATSRRIGRIDKRGALKSAAFSPDGKSVLVVTEKGDVIKQPLGE